MTAKEKAQDLVEHYAETIKPIEFGVILERDWKLAKQCALITVDELIKTDYNCLEYYGVLSSTEYWQEVKQEIEKL
jgi:hypothetical protein